MTGSRGHRIGPPFFQKTKKKLAILLVSFLAWLLVTSSKVVGDLQRLGIKRLRLESPGIFFGVWNESDPGRATSPLNPPKVVYFCA